MIPTIDKIKELFEYDSQTGFLIRKCDISNQKSKNTSYVKICIDRKYYYSHRLIYKLFNPEWDGNGVVDHIKIYTIADNRISNLRLTTHTNNIRNMSIRKATSIYKGVSWDKSRNKWRASIMVDRKPLALGRYENEIDAAIAYNEAAIKHFGEYALVNVI